MAEFLRYLEQGVSEEIGSVRAAVTTTNELLTAIKALVSSAAVVDDDRGLR